MKTNISDETILSLFNEALAAVDTLQIMICLRALNRLGTPDPDDPKTIDEDVQRVLRMTVDEARAECDRVIKDAQAQI